jgi:AbrB family looped-hinge helix DNA binding protein
MTAVLAQKGQIVIPKAIRDQVNLEAGDDFEVYLLDGEIVLRPLPKARNQGLANILLNPPGTLEIPERDREDFPEPLNFGE